MVDGAPVGDEQHLVGARQRSTVVRDDGATVGIRPTGCVSLRGRFTPPSVAANVVRRVLRSRTTWPVLAGLGLSGY